MFDLNNDKQSDSSINNFSCTEFCDEKAKSTSAEANNSQASSLPDDFRFPSPPRIDKNLLNSIYNISDSDTSDSDNCYLTNKTQIKKKKLPPIGVFWDIENCQVPKGRSAVAIAQLIRDLFFEGYREAEFLVVCDVKKESSQVIQELNDAQVTLIHVASTCKNAADEKLRQALRRFAETYGTPAAVILISGDINFAADLSDLRHRKKLHVILIHKDNAADALILCASEHYSYTNITQVLPFKEIKGTPNNELMEVIVRNLPYGYDPVRLRNRLKQLSDNCGGRVISISLETASAVVRFSNLDVAVRAQRRMDGEDVFGNKISVNYPTSVRNWDKSYSPYKYPARRITRNNEMLLHPSMYGGPPPVLPFAYPPMEYYNHVPSPVAPTAMTHNGAIRKTHTDNPQFPLDQCQMKRGDTLYQYQYHRQMKSAAMGRSIRGSGGGWEVERGASAATATATATTAAAPVQWRPHSAEAGHKRTRTPTEAALSNRHAQSFTALHDTAQPENFFQPVNAFQRSNSLSNGSSPTAPVELLVTNLDQTLEPQELKRLLLSMFKEHVTVLSVSLYRQQQVQDGAVTASVVVSSAQDAQYVICQLHRRKLGHKRVLIANAAQAGQHTASPHQLRAQVIALLQEVPGGCIPLFKFRELLEQRYRNSVSVSDLYRLRDVCTVTDHLGPGRMVTRAHNTPEPQGAIEMPHCVIHCPNGLGERGWAEPETPPLPNVRFKLKVFADKLHALLHSHMGTLPLPSFPVCYEIEIGEKLAIDESGVPLEHLITCIVGVELRLSTNMVKYIVWGSQAGTDEPHTEDSSTSSSMCSGGGGGGGSGGSGGSGGGVKCVSPPLATQLALFSRELVDLLKTAPHCQLPFSRFIPAYHHHFGRQCRVADYGYTKLVDLFDALSHIVQVIGEGNKRLITLSHSAQIRRFTSDLLRVLKSQASKQVTLSEFPAAYERVLSRMFDPVDYGLCDLSDLLEEVSENTVVIQNIGNDVIIAIPKREQTAEEIMRTKQFAVEVVDLLRHAPQYGMLFNKFVPAYHHHFGHQCRVSDYGFTKLIELFETIPEVVKIEETSDGERRVSLTSKEKLKVVSEQISALVKSSRLECIPLAALPATFIREHGYPLRPELYECHSYEHLISKLSDTLQLVSGAGAGAGAGVGAGGVGDGGGSAVVVVVREHTAGLRVWRLLLSPPHACAASTLMHTFHSTYGYMCTLQQMEKHTDILQIKKMNNHETEVSLTARYAVAARLYHLLYEHGGSVLVGNVDGLYYRKYGQVLRPADYEAASLNALVSQLAFLLVIRGRRNKRNISLNTNIALLGVPLPPNMEYISSDSGNSDVSSDIVQWPPPPFFFNSGKTTISPPKPDTPPTHGNSHWDNSMWSPSPNFTSSVNLCIPLPLVSPTKSVLDACSDSDGDHIVAPHPSELPMPNAELLNKGKVASPSRDSGISSTSFSNSIDEPDSSTNFETENITPTKKKRQLRLAAHFTTPLNFT